MGDHALPLIMMMTMHCSDQALWRNKRHICKHKPCKFHTDPRADIRIRISYHK